MHQWCAPPSRPALLAELAEELVSSPTFEVVLGLLSATLAEVEVSWQGRGVVPDTPLLPCSWHAEHSCCAWIQGIVWTTQPNHTVALPCPR